MTCHAAEAGSCGQNRNEKGHVAVSECITSRAAAMARARWPHWNRSRQGEVVIPTFLVCCNCLRAFASRRGGRTSEKCGVCCGDCPVLPC